MPRGLEDRLDGDAPMPLVRLLRLEPTRGRARAAPRLADTAAAAAPGALRERARAAEPVRALVAAPIPERGVATALRLDEAELPKPLDGVGMAEARLEPLLEPLDDAPGRGRALAALGTAPFRANAPALRSGRSRIESATRIPATPLGSTRRRAMSPRPMSSRRTTVQARSCPIDPRGTA